MAQEHDILGYLQSKGVHIKRAGGYEVNVPCMFHGEDPSKRGRLYINVDPRADIPGLYYCLAGETQVLTWEGYRAIKDLAGGRSLIMTEGGKWVDAPIRSFGEQPLRRVTLQRNKRIKVIHATPEHRWLVRRKKRWVTTDELQPGQPLAYAYGQGVKSVRPSAFGVAQGITYGDGTLVNGGKGAAVCLYDDELLPYFSLSPSSSGRTPEGTPFTRVADLPAYFKRLPDLDDSRSYLYGWLSGYFAADGDVTEAGQATLWSADPRVLEFVELLCNRIGVGTYGVRGPYFGKGRYNDNPMYAISFVLSTLTPEFFVQSKHLQRYRVPDAERKSWTVVSVEETDRVEEVFCATVEGTHNFVIEGNILTGNCHVCGEKGNLVTLKRHYGDQASGQDEESFDRLEIFRLASKFYQRELRLHEDVLDWLHGPERMLTDESIERFQIGYAPQAIEQDLGSDIVKEVPTRALYRYLRDLGYEAKDILSTGLCIEKNGRIVDSLAGMVTIPYQVAGSVVDIRGRTWPDRDDRPKYKTCSGRDTRLFNTDALWNVDEVLATEGEFDAIVMTQLGYNAVAFPGAKSWQDEWEGYFGPLRRVWLIFDRDRAGEEGAEKVSAKIGPKARRIHLSDVGFKCDPTQWVAKGNGAEEFNELIAAARRGNLLVSVDEAIQEFDSIQDMPGLKFGWEILDVMIDPGLQPTQLFIVLAKTGTGKTIMLLNMMDRMRRVAGQEDLNILFISLEQTRGEWWDRARRIYRFYNMQESDDSAARRWWQDNIFLIDRNRLTEQDLRTAVDDFEEQRGRKPDLIALDYLGYWAQSFKGERYERVSDAVMALKAIAKDLRVPIIVPHQVSRVGRDGEEFGADAARDSGIIEETADFLLTLWTPDNALGRSEEEKTGRIHARVAKSRHGGRGVLLNLQFAPLSLVMLPESDPRCSAARREITWRREYRDNWEKAIYRHRTGFEGHLDHVPDLAEQIEMDEVTRERIHEYEDNRYR